jgi:hypothetical protein
MRLGQLKFSSVLFKYKNRTDTIFRFIIMDYCVAMKMKNDKGTYFGYVEISENPRRKFSEN